MDRETAERLARLEVKLEGVKEDIDDVQRGYESWNSLIKRVISQSLLWLLSMAMAGAAFGWHLPENIRKAIMEWASK